MLKKLGLNKLLWGFTAVTALAAALIGLINPKIYAPLVLPEFLAGTVSQDIVTVLLALVVLTCLPRVKQQNWKMQIIIMGIMSYFWYGYGIWVIEQMYTPLYLLYLAVFGLSLYSIIISIASIRQEAIQEVVLTKPLSQASGSWGLLNPVIFYPLWISQLVPLIAGQAAGNAYSIYILDLCVVMPAFAILSFMTIRGNGLGLLLLPALFVKGFTLLFSVALGPLTAPFFGLVGKTEEVPFYLVLSGGFLIFSVLHLAGLRLNFSGQTEKKTGV